MSKARQGAREFLARKALRAREDPNEFIELTGRVEGNRSVPYQAPVHREWQDFLSENNRCVLFAPVGHGKSNQILRWRVEWEIGKNPDIRIGIFSVTQNHPRNFLSAIKTDIEQNRLLHLVFPHIKPSTKQVAWTADRIVVDRPSNIPDPTIQLCGEFGHILGARLDLIIIDDLCNMENTLTAYRREKSYNWLSSEVLSRLPPGGTGRVWAMGHPWHEEDPLMRLSRMDGYESRLYQATNKYTKDVNEEEKILIPELWDKDELYRRAKQQGPIYGDMMFWCRLPASSDSRIRQEWFDICLQRGRGLGLMSNWNPGDAPTYTGVDLGFSQTGAETSIFTACVLPEGSRRLLDLRSGRWTGPEIVDQLVDVHNRYGSIIAVEDNAAQSLLLQFASQLNTLPLRGHTTGMNKHHPMFGVEALGLELSQGKWIIPCDEELRPGAEVMKWIEESVKYSPEGHMGDRLSASWICRECMRHSPATGSVVVPDIDTLMR